MLQTDARSTRLCISFPRTMSCTANGKHWQRSGTDRRRFGREHAYAEPAGKLAAGSWQLAARSSQDTTRWRAPQANTGGRLGMQRCAAPSLARACGLGEPVGRLQVAGAGGKKPAVVGRCREEPAAVTGATRPQCESRRPLRPPLISDRRGSSRLLPSSTRRLPAAAPELSSLHKATAPPAPSAALSQPSSAIATLAPLKAIRLCSQRSVLPCNFMYLTVADWPFPSRPDLPPCLLSVAAQSRTLCVAVQLLCCEQEI